MGHSGLAVYSDGLYAKFCLGKTGNYEFKRFDEVEGIYPVDFFNPAVPRDSVILGLRSWKALQVETADYEVIVIDSRLHDFEVLVPVLKNALGPRWERIYHSSIVIQGRAGNNLVGVHSFVRGGPDDALEEKIHENPPPPTPDEQAVVKDKSRGSLVYQEPVQDVKNRKKQFMLVGIVFVVVGIFLMVLRLLMAFRYIFNPDQICGVLPTLIMSIGAVFMIYSGAMLVRVGRRAIQLEIFQKGIYTQLSGTVKAAFIPFGQVARLTEITSPNDRLYKFEAKNPKYTFTLKRSTPGIEQAIEQIRFQINKPELDYPVETVKIKNLKNE